MEGGWKGWLAWGGCLLGSAALIAGGLAVAAFTSIAPPVAAGLGGGLINAGINGIFQTWNATKIDKDYAWEYGKHALAGLIAGAILGVSGQFISTLTASASTVVYLEEALKVGADKIAIGIRIMGNAVAGGVAEVANSGIINGEVKLENVLWGAAAGGVIGYFGGGTQKIIENGAEEAMKVIEQKIATEGSEKLAQNITFNLGASQLINRVSTSPNHTPNQESLVNAAAEVDGGNAAQNPIVRAGNQNIASGSKTVASLAAEVAEGSEYEAALETELQSQEIAAIAATNSTRDTNLPQAQNRNSHFQKDLRSRHRDALLGGNNSEATIRELLKFDINIKGINAPNININDFINQAIANDPTTQFRIAVAYRDGIDLMKRTDQELSYYWYERAATSGNNDARYYLKTHSTNPLYQRVP